MTSVQANAALQRGSAAWWLRQPAITVPLALAVAAFAVRLWPEWTSNPDLSHGLFAPLVFVLLVIEGRRSGTQRWMQAGKPLTAAIVVLGVLSVVLFGAAGLFAASLQWTHSLVYFVLSASLACGLLAGALSLADVRVRVLPLNFAIFTAIGLWLLVAPLPPGTYSRLTMTLQAAVTSGVLSSLHVLGIPAQRIGNIIELSNTSVGVEEACSGIRSLLSCIYAGFLFAAWLVRGVRRRALIIVLAPVLAIAMNFARSLGLTLMANAGIDISGFWHDATGFAILGITAVVLVLVASALSPKQAANAAASSPPMSPRVERSFSSRAATTAGRFVIPGAAIVIVALAVIFAAFRPAGPVVAEDAPDVMAFMPAEAEGWHSAVAKNLYQFSDVLRTTHLGERTYFREINGEIVQLTVYIAHWPSGQAPVSLVASHTPDACWPGAGWEPRPERYQNTSLSIGGSELPIAEQRFFVSDDYPQYVWFWHIHDGRVINYRDPHSISALLDLALEYGFRRQGSQYFIRISSNQPWEKLAGTALLQQIVSNLRPLGLRTADENHRDVSRLIRSP